MSDACVTDSFARAKEAWSGLIRSPYPDGGASSRSYPPVQNLRHGRGVVNPGARRRTSMQRRVKALRMQNQIISFGHFNDLDAHDDSTLYQKEEPPQAVSANAMPGD